MFGLIELPIRHQRDNFKILMFAFREIRRLVITMVQAESGKGFKDISIERA
jgi:hypothetical protein